jgi:hypothetical protein
MIGVLQNNSWYNAPLIFPKHRYTTLYDSLNIVQVYMTSVYAPSQLRTRRVQMPSTQCFSCILSRHARRSSSGYARPSCGGTILMTCLPGDPFTVSIAVTHATSAPHPPISALLGAGNEHCNAMHASMWQIVVTWQAPSQQTRVRPGDYSAVTWNQMYMNLSMYSEKWLD